MKRKFVLIVFLISISIILIIKCSSSNDIGLVTNNKNDDEAIKEVVLSYFNVIKNYDWKNFNKNNGLEFWTKQGKEELLNNPNKLPYLEKSIIDNKITRALQKIEINNIEINNNTAKVDAITIEKGTSTNIRFSGTIQSYEYITLNKAANYWRISDRDAKVFVVQEE